MEVEAAVSATVLFLQDNYDACLQTLERLDNISTNDFKVALNQVLVEYYCGNGDAERLLGQLDALLEDHGPKLAEPLAAQLPSSRAATPASTDYQSNAEDEDVVVCKLNKALVLYHQQQYEQAAGLLEPILEGAECLHEGTALRLGILAIDAYIMARQTDRASAVLGKLSGRLQDSIAAAYQGDGAPSTLLASTTLMSQPHGLPQLVSHPLSSGWSNPPSPRGQQRPESAPNALGAEAVSIPGCSEAPSSSSAACAPEQQTAKPSQQQLPDGRECSSTTTMSLPSISNWRSSTARQARGLMKQQGQAVTHPDVGGLLALYRARLLLMQRCAKAAKRELKPVLAQYPGNTVCTLARAQVELSRGNSRKSAKQLLGQMQAGSSSATQLLPSRSEPAACAAPAAPGCPPPQHQQHTQQSLCRRAVLLNDLGVVHHHQGKHALAALYMTQAVAAADAAADVQRQPARPVDVGIPSGPTTSDAAPTPSCSRSLWVPTRNTLLYNLGVQHLMSGSYGPALSCLREAAPAAANRPLAQLRLAEAALGLARQQQAAPPSASCPPSPGTTSIEGVDSSTLLTEAVEALTAATQMLEQQQRRQFARRGDEYDACSSAPSTPRASAASQVPLGDSSSGDLLPADLRPHSHSACAAGFRSDTRLEAALLHQALLANLAYAHLVRGGAADALQAATALLSAPSLTPHHKFLGCCYAAEALCCLGRPAEAAEQLIRYAGELQDASSPAMPGGSGGAAAQEDPPSDAQTAVKAPDQAATCPTAPISMNGSGAEWHDGDECQRDESFILGNAKALARLTGAHAQASLQMNLALVHAQLGDCEQAHEFASLALQLDAAQHDSAVMLMVWCELRKGNMAVALRLLRSQRS